MPANNQLQGRAVVWSESRHTLRDKLLSEVLWGNFKSAHALIDRMENGEQAQTEVRSSILYCGERPSGQVGVWFEDCPKNVTREWLQLVVYWFMDAPRHTSANYYRNDVTRGYSDFYVVKFPELFHAPFPFNPKDVTYEEPEQ